jgi:hypothetical protein
VAATPAVIRTKAVLASAGLAALAVWLWLAIGLARTRVPWSSEAWSAIPALNLAAHGQMGTTILASQGTWLRGLEQHTYWRLPLHMVVQAVWYKTLGFSLVRQRLLSTAFGTLALASWFVVLLRLTGSAAAGLAGAACIGFEQHFLMAAANGREDMMAASLGAAALASWFALSPSRPRAAGLVAHALAAAAVFTHPCGALFVAALLTAQLRGERPGVVGVLEMALPYVLGLALWGAYAWQAPADFTSQLFGNVSGFAGEYQGRERFSGLRAPWHALAMEVRLRYWEGFGLSSIATARDLLRASWLVVGGMGLGAAAAFGGLRRDSGVRSLLLMAASVLVVMTLLEGMKFPHYLVYSVPFIGSVATGVGSVLARGGRINRVGVFAALAFAMGPQVKASLGSVERDPYHTEFVPVASWIRERRAPGDRVIAGAEFCYELGFGDALSDDVRLGYYTAIEPRFVVTSGWYRAWMAAAEAREPAVYAHIRQVLDHDLRRAYRRGDFVAYERAEP